MRPRGRLKPVGLSLTMVGTRSSVDAGSSAVAVSSGVGGDDSDDSLASGVESASPAAAVVSSPVSVEVDVATAALDVAVGRAQEPTAPKVPVPVSLTSAGRFPL